MDKGRVTVSTDDADKQDRGSDLNINDGANVRSSKDSSSSVISTDLEQPERRASENPDEVSPGSGSPAEVMTTALTTAATGGDATRFATLLPMAPPPDVYSYNSCIAACRRGGQAGLARLFFHEMMSRDLRPDVNTLKSMLLDRVKFAEHVGNVGPAQGTDAELLGDICSDEKEERREKEPPQHCPTEAVSGTGDRRCTSAEKYPTNTAEAKVTGIASVGSSQTRGYLHPLRLYAKNHQHPQREASGRMKLLQLSLRLMYARGIDR